MYFGVKKITKDRHLYYDKMVNSQEDIKISHVYVPEDRAVKA